MARRNSPENGVTRSLPEVAATGDRAATLRSLRDTLAQSLVEAGHRERAALAGQLRAVLLELEQLPSGQVSASDDLAERRRRRRAASKGAAPASRNGDDVRDGSG